MNKLSDFIEEYGSSILQQPRGLSTGLSALDSAIYGLQKGEQIIIGGRSSMGKTSLLLDLMLSSSKEKAVGLISLEMNVKEIIRRLLANLSGVGFRRIRSNQLLPNEKPRIDVALQELCRRQIFVDERTGLTVQQIEEDIKGNNQTIDCLFIDYLQLLRPLERYRNRVDEITEISSGLKSISKFFNISLITACQLNRSADSREETSFRPQLSDLRESGAIENDADVVLLLYRPYYYSRVRDSSATDDGRAEIIIAKNRNGPTSTIHCTFDADTMSFTRGEINRLSEQIF